jgi:hypothetical protein
MPSSSAFPDTSDDFDADRDAVDILGQVRVGGIEADLHPVAYADPGDPDPDDRSLGDEGVEGLGPGGPGLVQGGVVHGPDPSPMWGQGRGSTSNIRPSPE